LNAAGIILLKQKIKLLGGNHNTNVALHTHKTISNLEIGIAQSYCLFSFLQAIINHWASTIAAFNRIYSYIIAELD